MTWQNGTPANNVSSQNQSMELETYMTQVIKNVGALGEFCRNQFGSVEEKIANLENNENKMGDALTILIRRADEVTDMSSKLNTTLEMLSQATNQIVWKLSEADKKSSYLTDQVSTVRDLKVFKEISEERIRKMEQLIEKLNSNLDNSLIQFRNLAGKTQSLEESINELNKKREDADHC